MPRDKFAIRTRVAVPDTKGHVQGVIVWHIDSIDDGVTCGVRYLNTSGKPVTKPFKASELESGKSEKVKPADGR
jgi:hypothetical protein